MPDIAETALRAFSEASRPFVGKLVGVAKSIEQVEFKLSETTSTLRWLWVGVIFASAAASFFATLLSMWLCTS